MAKRKFGRQFKLSKGVIAEISAALATGASKWIAAVYAGISESSSYVYIAEAEKLRDALNDPETAETTEAELAALRKTDRKLYTHKNLLLELLEEVERSRAYSAVGWLNVINNAAATDPRWADHMLKMNFPKDYLQPQKMEHSGPDGAPIQTEDVGLTMEERTNKLLAMLEDAKRRKEESEGETADGGNVAERSGAA